MTIIERKQAQATLASYTEAMANEPVVVTEKGKPVAVLLPVMNADLETVSLSTNREFIELIEQSRAQLRKEGGISSKEMRRRFAENGTKKQKRRTA
jgi:prevent-host-death family protein